MTLAKNPLPNVGDVITSPKFAFGYYTNKDKEYVTVDGETESYPMQYRMDEEERVALAAKTGKIPPRNYVVELGAYDLTRASAKFVVEMAKMDGGDRDQCYPDGWHIKARRLNQDGKYNKTGEVIDFYMSGSFTCIVLPENVKIASKMQATFV